MKHGVCESIYYLFVGLALNVPYEAIINDINVNIIFAIEKWFLINYIFITRNRNTRMDIQEKIEGALIKQQQFEAGTVK